MPPQMATKEGSPLDDELITLPKVRVSERILAQTVTLLLTLVLTLGLDLREFRKERHGGIPVLEAGYPEEGLYDLMALVLTGRGDDGYATAVLEEDPAEPRWWLLQGSEARPYGPGEAVVTHEAYVLFYRHRPSLPDA